MADTSSISCYRYAARRLTLRWTSKGMVVEQQNGSRDGAGGNRNRWSLDIEEGGVCCVRKGEHLISPAAGDGERMQVGIYGHSPVAVGRKALLRGTRALTTIEALEMNRSCCAVRGDTDRGPSQQAGWTHCRSDLGDEEEESRRLRAKRARAPRPRSTPGRLGRRARASTTHRGFRFPSSPSSTSALDPRSSQAI